MKLRLIISVILAVAFGCPEARSAATLLPPGKNCWQATTGINGMVGLLGTITGGSGGTSGTYGGVALTGGSGSGATANITVSGGAVTAVAILNPGTQYVVGDTLSAAAANIGNATGFSVPVSSISINSSLAGGTVAFYIPNTSTFKQTWFNSDQAAIHQNANPVLLDANGCAVIYGIGSYREVVKDSLGNTVYDQITTDTSATNNIFWAGLAGGTPNAITVTDPGFNSTDGSIIQFIPLSTNTASTTISPSGTGPYQIVKDTSTGSVALSGGEIVAGSPSNVVQVVYSASQNNFHILNLVQPSATATPTPTPQGYLTILPAASGGPVLGTTDVTAATTLYYSPFVGNQIPIWNGSSFSILAFAELSIGMTSSAQVASTIYDVCVFNNAGNPTGVITPAWGTSTAGSGSRGSGAGTPQLTKQSGIWVNTVQISANNGTNTYTVPALQCTYVGSIYIDATPGQVSAYRTYGQSRKFGVWNAYNRMPITLQAGDATPSWAYNTATIRSSNASAANSLTTFTGLQEETIEVNFNQFISLAAANANAFIGIGVNSTTVFTGFNGTIQMSGAALTLFQMLVAHTTVEPGIGINTINALEKGSATTTTYNGTNANMLLRANWRG